MTKSKHGKSTHSTKPFEPHVPTHDYLAFHNLDDYSDLEELLENLIYDIESGYFLRWEAVIRREQGLLLTKKHEQVLSELISFGDSDDDEILYIDEIPRPNEPWYQIVRKIVPKLVIERFETYDYHYLTAYEGWPNLVGCLAEYGQDLSRSAGVESPIDVVPTDIQHRLWLQHCFVALSGLGQEEELTLENERQGYRIDWFIRCLKEHKDSVQFLGLTLEKLLTIVILPPRDEKIFIRAMLRQLGMSSAKERFAVAL